MTVYHSCERCRERSPDVRWLNHRHSFKDFIKELIHLAKNGIGDTPISRDERRAQEKAAGRKRTDGKLKGGTEHPKAIKEANFTREVLGK